MIPSDLKIKQTGGFNCSMQQLNKVLVDFEKQGFTVIVPEIHKDRGEYFFGIMYICEPKEDTECI